MSEALALIEVDSVARGYRCLDALVKRAPVTVIEANLIEPGRFLILFAGGVGEVEESYGEALYVAESSVVDQMLLPMVHAAIPLGLAGKLDLRSADEMNSLGVLEGRTVASTLMAADRSLKDADVTLAGLRVAVGLGGRAFYVVWGPQHDVEAAIEAGSAVLAGRNNLHRTERIARPHPEMVQWLLRPAPFRGG